MNKKIPKTLDSQFLIRVIRNEVSPEEKEFFYSWLAESNENKEEFGNLVLLWDKFDSAKTPPVPDLNAQWNKIKQKIVSIEEKSAKLNDITTRHALNVIRAKPTPHFFERNSTWLLRIAAIIIISIGLTFLFKLNEFSSEPEKFSEIKAKSIQNYELITQKGERKIFPLSDGTIVYLNADSKLIYPSTFSKSSREVEVVGEAYFSVVHENDRPFKVTSGNTVIVVTGTEFNVKYRYGKVNVVVAKGSVKTYLKNSNDGIDLTKGQMISFTDERGFSKAVSINLDHYLAWRSNKFSFERTPLSEAMAEIERYYNLEVTFQNDSVRNKRLTGIFKTDSLEQILSIISLTLDVKIDYKGSKVLIN